MSTQERLRDLFGRTPRGAAATPTAEDPLRQQQQAAQREVQQLKLRREQLAKQVRSEHGDLGGLTYEMAARDHFRLDVLVGRAAILQEHDVELAELDRKLAALAGGGAVAGAVAGAAAASGEGGYWRPPIAVWGALLPVFVAFGIGIGWAVSGPPSKAAQYRLVADAPAATAGGADSTTSTTSSGSQAAGGNAGENEPETFSSTTQTATRTSASGAPAAPPAKRGSAKPKPAAKRKAKGPASAAPATTLPPIKHVFVIMLSDEPYASLFGPESKATYLSNTLEHKGELLVRYDSVAHEALAGEVALISGQGPTNGTAADCQTYTAITPGAVGADGQVQGQGCVYPRATQTIGAQLAAKHMKWRVYVESGNGCSHPALGAADPTSASGAAVEAPTFIDPFLYFTSVTKSAACGSQNASLAQLESDLESEATTPNFAYIAPDRCHDANPAPCKSGAPTGPADADSFLESIVPKIMASAAYKKNGLIVITADNAPAGGEYADSSSCCGQPTFPNVSAMPGAGGSVRGGGQVGALLLSPYVKAVAAEHEQEPANTFSLLATFDHFFGVKPLGYAGASGVTSLAPSLFLASPRSA